MQSADATNIDDDVDPNDDQHSVQVDVSEDVNRANNSIASSCAPCITNANSHIAVNAQSRISNALSSKKDSNLDDELKGSSRSGVSDDNIQSEHSQSIT